MIPLLLSFVKRSSDMNTIRRRLALSVVLFGTLAAGCSGTVPQPTANSNEEAQVRERFQELQATLQSADADKLWRMLDRRSQTDADRVAKSIQTAYAGATSQEKGNLEETLGLTAAELATLSGKGYLKSKRFRRKYEELPLGKIDKVVIQEGKATVYFDEPDGDKEKAYFIREDGQWNAWLTMPTVMPSKSDAK
jgi:hypothetical protein